MQVPGQVLVLHDDATDLLSTMPTCYRSPLVTALRPAAAVLLALRLSFSTVVDTVTLAAIGIDVLSVSVVRPEDFGAVGDGVTDDGPAIQAALLQSWATKMPLHLFAKTYATAQELEIPQPKHTTIIGTRLVDGTSSTFKAIAPPTAVPPIPPPSLPMRAVLSMAIGGAIENLVIDGNYQALIGIYGQNCSLGTFRAVSVANCLRDGICFVGENDSDHDTSGSLTLKMLQFLRCNNTWVKSSRQLPHQGVTCSVVANDPVITFQGTIDLTTLGLSGAEAAPANVIIKSGNNIARCHLLSVDSAGQLTVRTGDHDSAPHFSAAGCDFSLSNEVHSINDTNSFVDCSGGGNGEMWNTPGADDDYFVSIRRTVMLSAAAAVTKGSREVTFAGGVDLYDLQLRQGDGIRVGTRPWTRLTAYAVGTVRTNEGGNYRVTTAGTSADVPGPAGTGSDIEDGDVRWEYVGVATPWQHGMINMIISPTRLTATFEATYTAGSLEFAIASGDGYHECPSSDNNINSFQGTGLWRGNANCHFAFSGLYGPVMVGQQMDYAGMYSIRVGQGGPVISPLFLRNYSEASGSGKMFFLWSTQGCAVHAPIDQYGNPDRNIDYAGDHGGGGVFGVYYGRDGIFELGVGGGYRTNLYTENVGPNPIVHGVMSLGGRELAPDSPTLGGAFSTTGTTLFTEHGNLLNPNDADYILTGEPTFAVTARQLILLSVKETQSGRVTLQDETVLPGSKLRLSSNRVSLGPGHAMLLYCDGIAWYEIGRTPPVNQTRCVASGGAIYPGQIVAALYDPTATGALKARNVTQADANGAGTLTNPIGASPGIANFAGTHFDVQSSGEMHVPDAVWAGSVPAVTDVGKPVYLAEAAGSWTMTRPCNSGSTVVRMGTITVGGAGLVMVLIRIGDPTVNS
jgi:hypothetical protein